MELLKKNIHMDRTRSEAVTQITLEDDLNVPEQKPDVSALNFEKGMVFIDEMKPGTDHVNIRGRLVFDVLYHTREGGCGLGVLEGKIPFEEKINMQGVTAADTVTAEGQIDDLNISIINSRKLSIRGLVVFDISIHEIRDAEISYGMENEEDYEVQKELIQARLKIFSMP